MINDRKIIISAAGSRKATSWPQQNIYWSELVEKLKTPVRSTETLQEYLKMSKSKQDDLKDVGGFVAGGLKGNKRGSNTVIGRDIITLDLDNIPSGGTQNTLLRLEGLGCGYAVYSTRKHEPVKPRLRVLLPLNRTCTADEYEPIARKIASIIGIELCDPTTFQASRLMYWPSCCADSQYVYQCVDKPFLDADGILNLYTDWRNIAEWAQVPGAPQAQVKLASKQSDPTEKSGVVGAFCKIYDIYKAIDTFIPDAYTPCDMDGRLTYTGGSTTAGAIVYDNGKFLYSHHATDPAGGKLCNAFDLIRLHMFGELDEEAKPDTPTNKLPSYTEMCKLAVADAYVAALMNQERYENATKEFEKPLDNDENWMQLIKRSATTGNPLKTTSNVRIVLEHDPLLKGKISKDTFADHIIGDAPLPWSSREKETGKFKWNDEDDSGLREHIEKILGFRSRDIIEDALKNHAAANGFNPVVDYLKSVEWDGIPRLDTLYIDYLGAEDCLYTRAVARKGLVAAVARAMDPGCKFDHMTVINGRQRIGKSTLFDRLGGQWFSDSLRTFEGKEASEMLQGVWILEIAELAAYGKTDIRVIKNFLSKRVDHYRAAYARKTEEHPRRCIFFGTTNDHDYLNDPTGNARFWPIEAEFQKPTKIPYIDLTPDEVHQIWAEAVMRWRLGEPLILSSETEEEAEKRRNTHVDRDPLQGQIEEFLSKPIPEDWQSWNIERRRMFWGGGVQGNLKLVPRDRICALEIWQECLSERRLMNKSDSNRISAILQTLPGWERISTLRFGDAYGRQRGFKRDIGVNIHCLNVNNGDKIVNILKFEKSTGSTESQQKNRG